MKLFWAFDGFGTGGGYGMSIHRLKMKQALQVAGIELTFDPQDSYDLAVHFIRPDYFAPIPRKRNLLFSACEMTDLTVPLSADPDVLVVPCKHNKVVFGKHFSGPIEICPEGIDPLLFPCHERKAPEDGQRFRFLYFGNDFFGTRKGAGFVVSAWKAWMQSGDMPPNCELYMKTTEVPGPELQVDPDMRMILDSRNLPVREIVHLFNSAHAFLLPSCGEGWGLTLTEAMATGLPCIWTHWSAPCDYADEQIGYPITDFEMIPFWKVGRQTRVGEPDYFGAAAKEQAIIERMKELYHNYNRALELGKAASRRMHSRFTWTQAAERFLQICESFIPSAHAWRRRAAPQ